MKEEWQNHHIIPDYRCKILWPEIYQGLVPGYKVDGVEFYFKENLIRVRRYDHARIHWGYKCDDLEPLFEYITPAQWIIDLIPRGDNRDVGAAVLTAKGELDGIDMSGKNNPFYGKKHSDESLEKMSGKNNSQWIDGRAAGKNSNPAIQATYDKERNQKPERKALQAAYNITPAGKARSRKSSAKYSAKKKAERQGEGNLKAFLK